MSVLTVVADWFPLALALAGIYLSIGLTIRILCGPMPSRKPPAVVIMASCIGLLVLCLWALVEARSNWELTSLLAGGVVVLTIWRARPVIEARLKDEPTSEDRAVRERLDQVIADLEFGESAEAKLALIQRRITAAANDEVGRRVGAFTAWIALLVALLGLLGAQSYLGAREAQNSYKQALAELGKKRSEVTNLLEETRRNRQEVLDRAASAMDILGRLTDRAESVDARMKTQIQAALDQFQRDMRAKTDSALLAATTNLAKDTKNNITKSAAQIATFETRLKGLDDGLRDIRNSHRAVADSTQMIWRDAIKAQASLSQALGDITRLDGEVDGLGQAAQAWSAIVSTSVGESTEIRDGLLLSVGDVAADGAGVNSLSLGKERGSGDLGALALGSSLDASVEDVHYKITLLVLVESKIAVVEVKRQ